MENSKVLSSERSDTADYISFQPPNNDTFHFSIPAYSRV